MYKLNGTEIPSEQYAKMDGKKWTVLGDSISSVTSHTNKFYFEYITEKYGMAVTNLAKSGHNYPSIYSTDVQNITADATDVVTIYSGANDLTTTIGTVGDTGTDTLQGLIYNLVTYILNVNPDAKIGIITPTPRYDSDQYAKYMRNIATAVKEECAYLSIPCFDLNSCSGFTNLNDTQMATLYDGDKLHPSTAGHKLIASKLMGFVLSLVSEE